MSNNNNKTKAIFLVWAPTRKESGKNLRYLSSVGRKYNFIYNFIEMKYFMKHFNFDITIL